MPAFLGAVHKGGIVHSVCAGGGGNAGDPQAAEIALSLFTADIGIVAGFHNCLLGSLKSLCLEPK